MLVGEERVFKLVGIRIALDHIFLHTFRNLEGITPLEFPWVVQIVMI